MAAVDSKSWRQATNMPNAEQNKPQVQVRAGSTPIAQTTAAVQPHAKTGKINKGLN